MQKENRTKDKQDPFLSSAKIILENESIRNFIPIILSKDNDDNIGTQINQDMLVFTISKIDEVLEVRHTKVVDLGSEYYKLTGIYSESIYDEEHSETLYLRGESWNIQNSQLIDFKNVKEYLSNNHLFPVLLIYKKRNRNYYDRFSASQSSLLIENPKINCNYFNYLEETQNQSLIKDCEFEEVKNNSNEPIVFKSNTLYNEEKYSENNKSEESENSNKNDSSEISVCIEEVEEYNYRFDLILEEKKPKGFRKLVNFLFCK